jgi:hypothetical protein
MSVPLEIHIWVLEFVEVHMLLPQLVSVIQDLQNQEAIVIRMRLLVARPFVAHHRAVFADAFLAH